MKNQRGSVVIWVIVILIVVIIAGVAYWHSSQNSMQLATSATTDLSTQESTTAKTPATPTSNPTTQPAPTQNSSAPSATIDQSSLVSTSENPTVTGTAKGLDSVEIEVSQISTATGGGPYPDWSGMVNVENGTWSFTPSRSNEMIGGQGGLSTGSYKVLVWTPDNNGTQPLITGTLTIQSSQQGNSNPSPPVAGMREYTDSNFGFSFWYPSSWSVTRSSTTQMAPFGTTVKRLEISGGTGQNNIEIDEVQFSGTSLTLPNAGCTASYSFSGQWMETDSGCDGATDTPSPFNGSYTMGGLPTFLDQNGISTQSWVVPLNGNGLQNDLFITPMGSYAALSPTVNTIVATNPSEATAQSPVQQTSAIQAEQSAYAGQ